MRMQLTSLLFIFACQEKTNPLDTAGYDTGDNINDTSDTSDTSDTGELDPVVDGADYTVPATDSSVWLYLDLETGTLVYPSNPEDSSEWDLKFQRYNIAVNGGVSGTGGVTVQILEGLYDSYETATPSDALPWITDEADSNNDGKPEYAFGTWYDYDFSTHILSPADRMYVLTATTGDVYKMRVVDYYGADGDSGYLSFQIDILAQ
jgi:hypothetical protein